MTDINSNTAAVADTMDNNLMAFSVAFNRIRCRVNEAREGGHGRSLEDVLTEIYKIADDMHNVPDFLRVGTPCNAFNLLEHHGPGAMGVDNVDWSDHHKLRDRNAG